MSFKEWAFANPTKTAGYLRLQYSLSYYQFQIDRLLREIDDLKAGIEPEWFVKRHEPKPFLFSAMIPDFISFVPPGINPEDHQQTVKKIQADRWEREALEAEENRQRAIKVSLEHSERELADHREDVHALEQELKLYSIDDDIFEWHPRYFSFFIAGDWRDNLWQHTLDCLTYRLNTLRVEYRLQSDDTCFHTLIAAMREMDVEMNMRYDGFNWYFSIRNESGIPGLNYQRIIRQEMDSMTDGFSATIGLVHTLLAFIDVNWDVLVYDRQHHMDKPPDQYQKTP